MFQFSAAVKTALVPTNSSQTSRGSKPWLVAVLCVVLTPLSARADDAFGERVVPFVKEYCVRCHNEKKSEGELDLTRYTSVEMLGEHFRQWEHVISFLRKEEMPPADAKQPSAKLRTEILETLNTLLIQEAHKLAGDPGVVLPRRLTNAEYNYTIRDLTGVDIQPANAFPIDPASGEGFNNTGEALIMSTSLFKKYYAAAEHVADHLLLKPSGFQFAPYSVVTFADQEKFYEGAIIRFYEQHDVNYESYLMAAWTFRYRTEEAQSKTIEQWADESNLSRKYLARLWTTLEGDASEPYYLGWLRKRWKALLAQKDGNGAANGISNLARDIQQLSQTLCPQETPAIVSNAGNPPIVHTDRRRKTAGERDKFNSDLIGSPQQLHVEFQNLDKQATISLFIHVADAVGSRDGFVVLSDLNFSTQTGGQYRSNDKERNTSLLDVLTKHAPDQLERLNFGKHPKGDPSEPGNVVVAAPALLEIKIPVNAFGPEQRMHFHAKATLDGDASKHAAVRIELLDRQPTDDDIATPRFPLVDPKHPSADKLRASCGEFCALFPNRFLYVDDTRGLSSGFHLIEGFFRDDQPLRKLVLDDQQNRELDRMWDELYFGTGIDEKLLRGFVFFERSERNFMKHADFDSIKEDDPTLAEDASIVRFRDIYLARSNVKTTGPELEQHPIYVFFESIRTGLRNRAAKFDAAKPIYLAQLEELARRACRRSLTERELVQLRSFFNEAAAQPEFGVEQAVRASLVRLLVSPHFCYRLDSPPAGDSVKQLPDLALASRLSYFVWASTPDTELLGLSESGKLHDEATLQAQTRRMLQNPKVAGFALEFFGQWLGYRDFLEQESVNRTAFRDFDDTLKQAMFDEPTRLITHLIQNDLPVTELLSSDATFVNERLAKHYDVPFNRRDFKTQNNEWTQIDGLREKGRGGLMGMAVFLTKHSQPERTSPVKRGFWVFHKVLGQHIPAPPPDVAVLPAKETDTAGKTIRELLKLHTDNAKCARCHERFDPIGLAMEGFDPIGRSRARDLAGRAIDNVVHLPNGKEARGVPEFAEHLVTERRDEFVQTLCRKFLGYALGRSLLLSDQPLLDKMESSLRQNNYRFSSLFETVVSSAQFRNQRCRDFTTTAFRALTSDEQNE